MQYAQVAKWLKKLMLSINLKKHFYILIIFFVASFSFALDNNAALNLYKQGNYKDAILLCENELQKNNTDMDMYTILCMSLIANKEYAEAEMWASTAKLISPYNQHITEVLGEAKYYLGKNDEALTLFQDYVSLVQNNSQKIAKVYYFMGEIYVRKGKFHHADIAFSQAVRNEPLNEQWWMRLAYAREKAKEYNLSFIAYEKVLTINPSNTQAINGKKRTASKIR